MSVFPARSICPNPSARISDAKITPFAGVLPEDKFRLVKAFQRARHAVGMRGDGASAHAAPGANPRPGGDGHRSHMACFVDHKALITQEQLRACGMLERALHGPLIWVKATAYSLIHSLRWKCRISGSVWGPLKRGRAAPLALAGLWIHL